MQNVETIDWSLVAALLPDEDLDFETAVSEVPKNYNSRGPVPEIPPLPGVVLDVYDELQEAAGQKITSPRGF